MLGLTGGAAGLACSLWASRLLWLLLADGVRMFAGADVLPLAALRSDMPVFVFTAAVSLAAAAAFGLVPALRLSRPDFNAELKDERPLSARVKGIALRRWFVGAPVAISMALLLAAGLLLRGLAASHAAVTGYDTGRIFEVMIDTLAAFAGTLAAIALLLALAGIYGVVAYLASLRRYEIGVRLALGARRVDILRLALGDAMTPVVVGAAIGLVCALGLSAVLRSSLSFPGTPDLLFGVSAFDLVTFAGATALVGATAIAASAGPLWRATRVDPLTALRQS